MKFGPQTKRLAAGVLVMCAAFVALMQFDGAPKVTNGGQESLGPQAEPSATSVALSSPQSLSPQSAPTTSATAPRVRNAVLVTTLGPVEGQPLALPIHGLNPHTAKGRVIPLTTAPLSHWAAIPAGDTVALPSFDASGLSGIVNLHVEEGGWHRLGGAIEGETGSFSLNIKGHQLGGSILLPERSLALEITTEPSGRVLLVERPLSRLICWPPAASSEDAPVAAATEGTSVSTTASASGVPQINTKPGAAGLIYLNFEGETVTDTSWNGGNTIVGAPCALSADGILEVIARVKEDYAPFDVAVSTIRADYENALVGRRMKVIITPTNTALPGSGGVSYTDSWSEAGGSRRSSTIPAWVFTNTNPSVKTIAEIVSHEVGHTLGLSHDGTMDIRGYTMAQYYSGHGGTLETPTSWAPIMGKPYTRSVTQWSQGEYANANNSEDDLAIISSSINGFGYSSAALAGDGFGFSGIALLPVASGTFNLSGVLRRSAQPDSYEFYTGGGELIASVRPSIASYANADLQLELRDAAGALLAFSNPPAALEATIAKTLPPGTYKLLVRSAQTDAAPANGYTIGYSAYGSLGAYQLSGSVENEVPLPVTTSASEVTGVVGKSFAHTVTLSPGAQIAAIDGTLPLGLLWNAETRTLSGIPTTAGTWTLDFTLITSNAINSRSLKIQTLLPLPSIVGSIGSSNTSAEAPWLGQLCTLLDGTRAVMAVSGAIPNSAATSLKFRVPGKSVFSFVWRTSTELGKDIAQVWVNGLPARDIDTGNLVSRSGESSWIPQRIAVGSTTPALVEVRYAKDSSLAAGQDRVWFGNVKVGAMPLFKKAPLSQRLKVGQTSFSVEAMTENATELQWKKDGISLSDGTFGTVAISGTRGERLMLSGVSGLDSGSYTLEATNSFTTVASRPAEIAVPGAPVLGAHGIIVPSSLHTGDTLLLTLDVAGAKPLTTHWRKDGRLVRSVQGTTLQIRNATQAFSGRYTVTVVNMYGKALSEEAVVTIAPRTAASTP